MSLPHNPIARHPWILVVVAFLVLIGAWYAVIQISSRIPNQKITREQEARLLSGKEWKP